MITKYIAEINYTMEEDDFKNGCLPETYRDHGIVQKVSSVTKQGLLDKIKSFTCTDNIERFNERLIAHTTVNANSYIPSNYEIEQWKKGKVKLYNANYDIYVSIQHTEEVSVNYEFSKLSGE